MGDLGRVQLAGGWTLVAREVEGGVRVFELRTPRDEGDEVVHTYNQSTSSNVEHVERERDYDTFMSEHEEALTADALRARAALYERVAADLDGRVATRVELPRPKTAIDTVVDAIRGTGKRRGVA